MNITKDHIRGLMQEALVEAFDVPPKTTIVSMTLRCGFTIVESSSCISPENYSQEQGVKICLQRIEEKLWELEGYRLHYLTKLSTN